MDADVIIVGGGPVGLVTALHAHELGLRPLILEATPHVTDKACGEGLMPGALAEFSYLGIDPPGYNITRIAYINHRRRVEHDLPRPGRGVRRTALHHTLLTHTEHRNIPTVHGTATGYTQDRSAVTLTYATRGHGLGGELRAPWMIACDGLHSSIRRYSGLGAPASHEHRRYGIRQHFAVRPWNSAIEVYWNQDTELYVTPVDDHTVGVAMLGAQRHDLATEISQAPALAARLHTAAPASTLRGAGPLLQRTRARTNGRVLLAGDAAGYIDALTGEGLRSGFAQGRLAAHAIARKRPDQYEHEWARETRLHRYLTRSLLCAVHTPAARSSLVEIAARHPPLFAAVVDRLAR